MSRPEVVHAQPSPDGRLVARLVRTDAGGLSLDIGVADDGPFTTMATLANRSEPFPLRWQGAGEVQADLPCAVTTLRGQLREQISLPGSTGPITVSLSRPAGCKLPVTGMR